MYQYMIEYETSFNKDHRCKGRVRGPRKSLGTSGTGRGSTWSSWARVNRPLSRVLLPAEEWNNGLVIEWTVA